VRLAEEAETTEDLNRRDACRAMISLSIDCLRRVREGVPGWEAYEHALRREAAHYADHPEYREEWRPGPARRGR
jgi:hypothetical protein